VGYIQTKQSLANKRSRCVLINEFKRKCYIEGRDAEQRFASKHLSNIHWSTKQQDMFEHWDVEGVFNGNKYKFDVKTTKRNTEDSTWVEGTNVNGDLGWVKGIADYIVFERIDSWLVVDRKQLLNMTMEKLKQNNFQKGKGIYLIYQRNNRKDKITIVPFNDMKEFCTTYELTK